MESEGEMPDGVGQELDDPQTYAIIGAAMAVHRELGHGFLESTYQEALAVELGFRGIPHERERVLRIKYRGAELKCGYKADFLCHGCIIVELKALDKLSSNEEGQLLHYLKAANVHRGLLINFGAPKLEFRRMVWGSPR